MWLINKFKDYFNLTKPKPQFCPVVPIEPVDKQAELTMLMMVAIRKTDYVHILNVMCDNTNFSTVARKDKFTFYFHKGITNPELQVGDTVQVCLDYTNDPSPQMAGHCVSLGYYTLRPHIKKCTVMQTQPYFIAEGEVKDYEVKFTRPQRLLYCTQEDIIFSKIMPTIEKRVQEITAGAILKNASANN